MNIIGKRVLATTLAASAIVSTAAPAMARDYYRDRGDNTAAVAIGAGIIGLAVGALVASSNDNRRDRDERYYDRRYQTNDGRYYRDSRSGGEWHNRGRYDDRSRYDDRYYSRRGY